MSWITKDSTQANYEKRDKPWLSKAMKDRWTNDLLPRYATSQGALMMILHDVQHEFGYIPTQAMFEIAQFLDITPGDVMDTVSFYEDFFTEPVGKCVIAVCQSMACEVCGHQAILDHLREVLNIEPHETTADGLFTLLELECLGSCDTAPVALFGETLHENLTIERVDELIAEHRK